MTKALTHNSFSITGRGIIVFLQHDELGLLKGTVLREIKSGLIWKIDSRILFDHIIEEQIKFEGESLNYMNLSFDSAEKMEESRKKIIDDEKHGIFQYMIKPVGHDRKPNDKDELEITTANTMYKT
jgi:hypothetical protein